MAPIDPHGDCAGVISQIFRQNQDSAEIMSCGNAPGGLNAQLEHKRWRACVGLATASDFQLNAPILSLHKSESKMAVEWRLELNNYVQDISATHLLSVETRSEGPQNKCTWHATVTFRGTVSGRGSAQSKQQAIELASKEALKTIRPEKYEDLLCKQ